MLGDEPNSRGEITMMNWTDEIVRAEADYRREQLHKLASPRRARRSGGRNRWWHLALRH
jgi:hypothetical protein